VSAKNVESLILDNRRLVYYLLHRYYPTFSSDEDLIQCGMVGLCVAANKWDETRSSFSSYACHVILNSFKKEFNRRRKHQNQVSLDEEIDSSDGRLTLCDTIPSPSQIHDLDFENLSKGLTEKELQVLELIMLGKTQNEIAIELNHTQSYISKVYKKIKKKWRNIACTR